MLTHPWNVYFVKAKFIVSNQTLYDPTGTSCERCNHFAFGWVKNLQHCECSRVFCLTRYFVEAQNFPQNGAQLPLLPSGYAPLSLWVFMFVCDTKWKLSTINKRFILQLPIFYSGFVLSSSPISHAYVLGSIFEKLHDILSLFLSFFISFFLTAPGLTGIVGGRPKP